MTARVLRRGGGGTAEALRLLARGEVVIVPTDLVYGFACAAADEDAVARIKAIKSVRAPKPIPLFANPAAAGRFAHLDADRMRVLEFAWPGGVSFVFRRRSNVPDHLTGDDSIMLVCPDPWVADLVERSGFPIAATSANEAASSPCLTAEACFERFSRQVNLIVDGGPCRVGKHTTIVDWREANPRIVRVGAVPEEETRRLLDGKAPSGRE